MARQNEHIQVSGGKARVHREIKQQLTERWGFEPTHSEVYLHLIEHYDGPLDVPPNSPE